MDEVDITNEIMEAAKNQIKGEFEKFGLELEIKSLKNSEAFVEHYYKQRGYSVIRATWNEVYKHLGEEPRLTEELMKIGIRSESGHFDVSITDFGVGCPDFLVWKFDKGENRELFFVEAKGIGSGLSFSQIKWIAKHPNVPVKVMWSELSKNYVDPDIVCPTSQQILD